MQWARQRKKPLKRSSKPLRRTKLRVVGHSTSAEIKNEIQALLRDLALYRDGGCILRHYRAQMPHQFTECGPYRNDGKLVLQFDHMITRANAATFADLSLGNILCQRHHFYFKKQYPDDFLRIALQHMGPDRIRKYEFARMDHSPHHMTASDWRLLKQSLEQDLVLLNRRHEYL